MWLADEQAARARDRFYPLFGQLANIAPICSGQTVAYFARRCDSSDDSFGDALQGTTCLILAAGVCLMGLYANIQVSSSVCAHATRPCTYLPTHKEFFPHAHKEFHWCTCDCMLVSGCTCDCMFVGGCTCDCMLVSVRRMCLHKVVCVCVSIWQDS